MASGADYPFQSSEPYVPLSKGLREHLGAYSGNALKTYIWLLTGAGWLLGPDYGIVEFCIVDLMSGGGLARNTAKATLQELARGYPVGILSKNKQAAPALIDILESRGSTRGKVYRVRIRRAKMTAACFASRARAKTELEKDIAKGKVQEIVDDLIGGMDARKLFGK